MACQEIKFFAFLGLTLVMYHEVKADSRIVKESTESLKQEINTSAPKGSILDRFAEKAGLHRDLITEFLLPLPKGSTCRPCNVALLETIPSGMYVDLYQIADQIEFGGPAVLSEKDFDVEAPEMTSSSQNITVFHTSECSDEGIYAKIPLPVHFRYHAPSEDEHFTSVIIENPQVLLKCPDTVDFPSEGMAEAPCDASNSALCNWNKVSFEKNAEAAQFFVPVGNKQHLPVVAIVTLTFTLLGTLVVIYAICSDRRKSSIEEVEAELEKKLD